MAKTRTNGSRQRGVEEASNFGASSPFAGTPQQWVSSAGNLTGNVNWQRLLGFDLNSPFTDDGFKSGIVVVVKTRMAFEVVGNTALEQTCQKLFQKIRTDLKTNLIYDRQHVIDFMVDTLALQALLCQVSRDLGLRNVFEARFPNVWEALSRVPDAYLDTAIVRPTFIKAYLNDDTYAQSLTQLRTLISELATIPILSDAHALLAWLCGSVFRDDSSTAGQFYVNDFHEIVSPTLGTVTSSNVTLPQLRGFARRINEKYAVVMADIVKTTPTKRIWVADEIYTRPAVKLSTLFHNMMINAYTDDSAFSGPAVRIDALSPEPVQPDEMAVMTMLTGPIRDDAGLNLDTQFIRAIDQYAIINTLQTPVPDFTFTNVVHRVNVATVAGETDIAEYIPSNLPPGWYGIRIAPIPTVRQFTHVAPSTGADPVTGAQTVPLSIYPIGIPGTPGMAADVWQAATALGVDSIFGLNVPYRFMSTQSYASSNQIVVPDAIANMALWYRQGVVGDAGDEWPSFANMPANQSYVSEPPGTGPPDENLAYCILIGHDTVNERVMIMYRNVQMEIISSGAGFGFNVTFTALRGTTPIGAFLASDWKVGFISEDWFPSMLGTGEFGAMTNLIMPNGNIEQAGHLTINAAGGVQQNFNIPFGIGPAQIVNIPLVGGGQRLFIQGTSIQQMLSPSSAVDFSLWLNADSAPLPLADVTGLIFFLDADGRARNPVSFPGANVGFADAGPVPDHEFSWSTHSSAQLQHFARSQADFHLPINYHEESVMWIETPDGQVIKSTDRSVLLKEVYNPAFVAKQDLSAIAYAAQRSLFGWGTIDIPSANTPYVGAKNSYTGRSSGGAARRKGGKGERMESQ